MDVEDEPSTSSQPSVPVKKKFLPIQTGFIPPQIYINDQSKSFSHMTSRMMPEDCVAREIYNAGPKGIDRIQIAEKLGIDARTKSGSRKISSSIQILSRGLPNEAGVYQKLNGKVRIHYFFHKIFQPNAYADLVKSISDLIGRECPIQIGQVMDFPGQKLTRMRITDLTLKRMLLILREVYKNEVSLLRSIYKIIEETETAEGSKFIIDRKTLQKIYSALQHYGLLRVQFAKILVDPEANIESELILLCSPDVEEPSDPRIHLAITNTQRQYQDEGRIFPGGQIKKRDTKAAQRQPKTSVPKLIKQEPEVLDAVVPIDLKPDDATINYSQKKMIKLHVLHAFLFRLLYHPLLGNDTVPTYYDRFPVTETQRAEETPTEEMVIYDDEDDTFFRFVPPMPPPNNVRVSDTGNTVPQGWFVLKDIVKAMPLSVYVLVNDMELNSVFDYYLNDPEKRNILINDLPLELRRFLFNKRTTVNIDYQCVHLCGLGLLIAATDKGTGAHGWESMYYVRPNGILYDTSTANKSYAIMDQNFEEFRRYEYKFETKNDIQMFWYHLRAIALSTPMNVRNMREKEIEKVDGRKFSKESYIKEPYATMNLDDVTWSSAELPGRGAACMDPALFVHLKRQWDLVNIKKPFVEWFITHYRDDGERFRMEIELRVERLNRFWLSAMQLFVNGENDLFKKRASILKKPKTDKDEPPVKKSRILNLKAPIGKRAPDDEDIEASKKSHLLRNRFSQSERDLMVLMRAVGQFLNPTSKLWIDPIVMRKIMKAYLEESYHKTVITLLGASCREANIPQRQADIWHLVRGLGSFTQMRKIRDQMASVLNEEFEQKAEYFYEAFDIAYRLVTHDIPRLPSPMVNDSTFYGIMEQNNLTLGGHEFITSTSVASEKPENLNEIQEAVMYDCVMNVLMNETNNVNNKIVSAAVSQKDRAKFFNTLSAMLDDGIAVRTKADVERSIKFKQQYAVSLNFCYYFSHTYRHDIWRIIEKLPVDFADNFETYSDNLAAFLRLSFCLVDDESQFEIDVGLDAFPMLGQWRDATNRKFQRITESGALRLAAIPVAVESDFLHNPSVLNVVEAYEPQPMPEVKNIEEGIYDSEEIIAAFCANLNEDEKHATLQIISSIKDSTFHGKTLSELRALCFVEESVPEDVTDSLLTALEKSHMIFACGIDTVRYVHIRYALEWGLNIDGKVLFVKPWTNDDGTVDYSTFRWMAEMVFATINESPDITLTNVKSYFSNIIHPVFVDDIVEFLCRVQIIEKYDEQIIKIEYINPFLKEETLETETSVRALFNGVDLFALIFQGIDIPEFARQKHQNQSSQDPEHAEEEVFDFENEGEVNLDDSIF
uniref:GTF3C1 extended winged-helix domain-containing protein n=1 Tax=Panagrolaimus superbus TaxID=310955 RepID=A0A914Z8R7_9BILA